MRKASPVESPRKANTKVVAVSRVMPMRLKTRGPCVSNKRPAIGPMMPMRMAPGISTRPETVAEYPM